MRFSAVQAAAAVALSSLLIPACASAARSVGTPSGAVASDATASRQPPTDAPQSAAAASADAVRVAGAAGVVGAEAGHADTGPLLRKAGELLDTALVQQEDPRLWTEAGASLGSARTALITARQQGARRSLVEPALSTIDALDAWRALQESAAADEATDPALADSRHAWRAAFEQAAVTQLDAARGAWPQTDEALLTVLFEAGRSDEAARELAETLRQDPSRRQVHALVHTWRDAIADPHALLPLLDGVSWSGDATAPDGGASRLATTRGYLRLSLGIAMQATSDADAAAAVFEQGAADFEAARAAPVTDVSDWELLSRRTDCLVNAARLHEGLAEAALPSGAGGVAAAQPELVAAERDYGDALAASPADEDASAGLALTGDAYYRGGSVEGARDFFGRVARRFDVPSGGTTTPSSAAKRSSTRSRTPPTRSASPSRRTTHAGSTTPA